MNKTKIPLEDFTWSPVTGCTPVSDGCQNCYAERVARRFVWNHCIKCDGTGTKRYVHLGLRELKKAKSIMEGIREVMDQTKLFDYTPNLNQMAYAAA